MRKHDFANHWWDFMSMKLPEWESINKLSYASGSQWMCMESSEKGVALILL